ncbi:MAG: WG repeat-containing protein, partial [bacterium]|nr:WG repeat-containing protein [bacterium]
MKRFVYFIISLAFLAGLCFAQEKLNESSARYLIKKDGKFGYIDRTGRIVIQPQFEDAEWFQTEEPMPVKFKRFFGLLPSKWGYIDRTGKIIIKQQFEGAGNFSEGLASVYIKGLWGLIDTKGQRVNGLYKLVADFQEGLAGVEIGYKWGYIDKTGKIVIKPLFDFASPFEEDIAYVRIDKKHGFINKSGKFIIPPQYKSAYRFSEGLAAVRMSDTDKW